MDNPPSEGAPSGRAYQAEADTQVAAFVADLPPEDAALALATLLTRAATRLHNLARGEASARKGQPEWPTWAALQNAARNTVLGASTTRDQAGRLPRNRV